jgi:hypothetical protein
MSRYLDTLQRVAKKWFLNYNNQTKTFLKR